jgi:eukaryotic-like serine/threonine-protein kinase
VLSAETPLASGAAARVSLVGAYATGNPMPTAFELAGHSCEGQVVGAAAPPVVSGGGAGVGGPGPGAGPAPPGGSNSGPGSDSGSGSNSGPGSGPEKPGKGKKGKG